MKEVETASVELTYEDICALLESGTVKEGSALQLTLRGARDWLRKNGEVRNERN